MRSKHNFKPYKLKKIIPLTTISEEIKYYEDLSRIQTGFNLLINKMTEINVKDLINDARSVPSFRGDDTFELTNFINEVEAILNSTQDANAKKYLQNILTSKIQGPAAVAIRRIQDNTWDSIKNQLKKSFGVRESYLRLKEEADSIKFHTVSQIYSDLSKILDKLNLKYKLDDSKPIEYEIKNNENSILEKFLGKIQRVDSMFIRQKNVTSLEEAYFLLLETGISPNNQNNKHNFKSYQNNNNYRSNNSGNASNNVRNFNNRTNNYNNHSSNRNSDYNHRNNNYNNNYNYNSNNYNRNFNNNRFNNNSIQSRNSANNNYNNNNRQSGISRNYSSRFNRLPEPMEVDLNHTEQENQTNSQENFRFEPRNQTQDILYQ